MVVEPLEGHFVSAEAAVEESGDASDGCHGDAGFVVDFAIRFTVGEGFYDAPAIGEGFQFGGRTEVSEEVSALFHGVHGGECSAQFSFGGLGFGVYESVWAFHR